MSSLRSGLLLAIGALLGLSALSMARQAQNESGRHDRGGGQPHEVSDVKQPLPVPSELDQSAAAASHQSTTQQQTVTAMSGPMLQDMEGVFRCVPESLSPLRVDCRLDGGQGL